MDNKVKEVIAEIGYNPKSLQKMRKSELLEVVELLMGVIDGCEVEIEEMLKKTDGVSKTELNRWKIQAEGATKEMEHWRKKFEELKARTSGRIGHGGVKNPEA